MRALRHRSLTLALGGLAVVGPAAAAVVPAHAAANPGQPVENDYGQSPAEVTAEVNAAVDATPAVQSARAKVTAAKAALAKRTAAEKAAKAALAKAVKGKKKPVIAKAKAALAKAHAATLAAQKAYAAAVKSCSSVVAARTAAVRATHYTPVDGTWTGDLKYYYIADNGLEPLQVEITVYGGHVSNVTASQYVTTGESGDINAMAMPILLQRAMDANDTAAVASVSGASLTSYAFTTSLQSALHKAGWK